MSRVQQRTHFIPSSNRFQIVDNFESRCRIQPRSRFIQEYDLWCRDELCCDAHSAFLPAGYSLPDGCSDQIIGLIRQSKIFEQYIHPLPPFVSTCGLCQRQASGEFKRLSNRERAYQRILLLDICRYATKLSWIDFRTAGEHFTFHSRICWRRPVRELVQQGGFPRTAALPCQWTQFSSSSYISSHTTVP